jgi:hypothetical protein
MVLNGSVEQEESASMPALMPLALMPVNGFETVSGRKGALCTLCDPCAPLPFFIFGDDDEDDMDDEDDFEDEDDDFEDELEDDDDEEEDDFEDEEDDFEDEEDDFDEEDDDYDDFDE